MEIDSQAGESHSAGDFLTNDASKRKKKKKQARSLAKRYKFSDKKHSRGGIVSSLFALAAFLGIIAAVIIAAAAAGEGGMIVGILGGGGFAVSFIGIIIGLLSFRKTDVFYRFSWMGLISNLVIWLLITCVIVIFS